MSSIVEVTREGFGSRGKKSMGGVVFGVILLPIAIFLIFWNEGRAVKRYQDLKEGAGAFVSIESGSVDPANEKKLVHTSGEAVTKEPLIDKEFGLSESAISLRRKVEMYQWEEDVQTETQNKTGGGTETTKTYSYRKVWNEGVINTGNFKKSGYENPKSMPYSSNSILAKDVTVGDFAIPEFLVKKIGNKEAFLPKSLENASPEVKSKGQLVSGYVYFGANESSPEIGDVRVNFSIIRPGPISIVAQQQGNTFVTFKTKNGTTLDLLENGIVPAEEMFSRARTRNKMLTWAIRAAAFFMLAMGFSLIFKPLVVFASILPFLGRIAETGTSLISFLLAGVVWAICVAIAWVFYRPVIGIIGLVLAIALFVWILAKMRATKNREKLQSSPPPMDTPPPLG